MAPETELPKKPLYAVYLRSHFRALDAAFRGLGSMFKSLTYEQGRVASEYDSYPEDAKQMLGQAVEHLNQAGTLLQKAALKVRARSRGMNEETD